MDRLAVASLSKINLHLRVGAPRADGFHPLRSWMVTTDLYDWIEFRRVVEPGIRLTCNDPSIPVDGSNLIVRAADAILDRLVPAERFGLDISLTKSIPAGAGLGGGSGNAATALRAVNDLAGKPCSDADLSALAAQLGSDVPFFLGPPSAVATGRGEHLEPVPLPDPRFAILILPAYPISTARAYRVLDELRPVEPAGTLDPFDADAWSHLGSERLLSRLRNDLEAPAFVIEPRLGELRSAIEAHLERTVRMSGSGSTLFTLFDTMQDAARATRSVRATFALRVEPVELGVADVAHAAD
jgi:4-diphosphocytidyl-2-C-methyl-D-erythritol kinase